MILGQDDYCHRCGKISCMCKYLQPAYDKAVVACQYANETVPAVICMKESRNTNFAGFAARILAERLKFSLEYGLDFDDVMPVPMHPAKQRMRGYNQAGLIAREIASLLQLSYREDVLYKNKSGTEQHQLSSAKERALNVSNFAVHDISLKNRKILLCDDVLTTGATMNYCAALLKQQGAACVIAAAASATAPKQKDNNQKGDMDL